MRRLRIVSAAAASLLMLSASACSGDTRPEATTGGQTRPELGALKRGVGRSGRSEREG
jgi:hypothetical protein